MAAIELRNVTKKFATADGGTYTALKDLSLTVEDGQFCAVVGPDGLRQVDHADAGLRPGAALAGEVARPRRAGPGIDTGIGFVFQQDAVFPWRTVLDNVAAGPRLPRRGRREATRLARDWLRRVGLTGFEDRYPHQLSGGMRKRVALAQTLINEPRDPAHGRALQRARRADPGADVRPSCSSCGTRPGRRSSSSPTTWRRPSRWPTRSS